MHRMNTHKTIPSFVRDRVYSQKVTRFQFYVFEIARCRRGMNDWVFQQARKEKSENAAK